MSKRLSARARAQGYRPLTGNGPSIRTDVVDVYVFRRQSRVGVEFLQLLRTEPPLADSWHPVMGHVEVGETSTQCAWRELHEEVGLKRGDPALLGLWALEQVHPFYIAAIDSIVMSPRFAAEVSPRWRPRLNDEHARSRWVPRSRIGTAFMWPGQQAACREVLSMIVAPRSVGAERVRIYPIAK